MTTAIIITLSVLLLASVFLLGRVGMLSSSRYNKIRALNAKLQRYHDADIDASAIYAVRKMITDNPDSHYNNRWAVCRVSIQDGYIHHTLIKAFTDEDEDFNKLEADELCEKLNEK